MSTEKSAEGGAIQLSGVFAFKVGMTRIVNATGEMVPCTVLKYEPWKVSQVKTKSQDGYDAVQLACRGRKEQRSPKAQRGHLAKAGFGKGAYFVHEIRQTPPESTKVGDHLDIESLKIGDVVKVTARSKGKGFAGSVKRWNAGGGPAAHGSCFHRQPGSSGNRTWPGRIMKGKHFPGHLGDEMVTVRNIKVLEVLPKEQLVIVSGCVPGSKNCLVRIMKEMH